MILQTENPVRMVRELKGAPLSIIIALSLVQQRVSQEWLERSTGYTDKPISQALQYLQENGLVDQTSAGWQLVSEKARQLVIPLELEDTEQTDPSQDNPEENENIQSEAVELSRNNSDSVNLSSSSRDNNINNNISTTTNLLNSNEIGKIPTSKEIQQVLDAAETLFGHRIIGNPRDYADIDRLISWIAQAYQGCYEQGRLKIQNPAGLVYWAFHQGKDKQPEKKYLDLDQADRFLPESFRRDSGQWEFEE